MDEFEKKAFMNAMGSRVRSRRESLNMSQEELALRLNYKNKASISRIEAGLNEIPQSKMKSFAAALDTSVAYLMGWEKTPQLSMNSPAVAVNNISFPILGEIAAGYEHLAYESWDNGNIDIPESWLKGKPKDAYFVVKVIGNSMYPDYQDGDLVLALKQDDVDYSGQVALALYDDECATLKRVEFDRGRTWYRFRPINPQYEPIVKRGEEIDHCRILGIPKKLIRNIEE